MAKGMVVVMMGDGEVEEWEKECEVGWRWSRGVIKVYSTGMM